MYQILSHRSLALWYSPGGEVVRGYMGRLLFVDLTGGRIEKIPLPGNLQKGFIGGKGFGARLLYDLVPPGIDPFQPENLLSFMPGPLTGTLAPATRGCVVTKSPLTGTFVDSYYGGFFSGEIKYAGYDGILIVGRAEKPVYLWVDDDRVEIRDASHLWGQDTFVTNAAIKEELGDPTIKVACIGPAGENLVRFALISCEYNRQAGRGGTGAVMGSKNLKALAFRGRNGVRVKDPAAFLQACEQAFADLRNEPSIEGFTIDGTVGSIPFANEEDLLPTRNYSAGQFENVEGLYPERQREAFWLRNVACAACPLAQTQADQTPAPPDRPV